VAMLTSVIQDEAGHPIYRVNRPPLYYYCRKGCGTSVPLEYADSTISDAVINDFGHLDHYVRRTVPGKNWFEEIAQLRQDRNELDDLADDYDERHAALTAEIRRLSGLKAQPDTVRWVPSGKTVAQHWESLTTAQRRDWLIENGWKVTAIRDDSLTPPWRFGIDAGWTAEVGAERQAASLGAR
jgi:hypothetical protein